MAYEKGCAIGCDGMGADVRGRRVGNSVGVRNASDKYLWVFLSRERVFKLRPGESRRITGLRNPPFGKNYFVKTVDTVRDGRYHHQGSVQPGGSIILR